MLNAFVICFALLVSAGYATAGQLSKSEVEALLEGRFIVGDIQADVPAYPLFQKNPSAPSAKPELAGYVFETIDLEPVRGYSGKPIDLLVMINQYI